jgi:hypothetical protein
MDKTLIKHETMTDVHTVIDNALMCEFSSIQNKYKEMVLTDEMTIEKAKQCLNSLHHDKYAEDMCRDWEFDGKFGKFFDECMGEEMYFSFDKPKYVA